MILRSRIDPAELPDATAISAVTLAELSAGPHQVAPGDHTELARRLDVLQRTESEFDPVPFDAAAARTCGRMAVAAAGRTPRRRAADLMIASVAIAEELPLHTTNPRDYAGLDAMLTVVAVSRPAT